MTCVTSARLRLVSIKYTWRKQKIEKITKQNLFFDFISVFHLSNSNPNAIRHKHTHSAVSQSASQPSFQFVLMKTRCCLAVNKIHDTLVDYYHCASEWVSERVSCVYVYECWAIACLKFGVEFEVCTVQKYATTAVTQWHIAFYMTGVYWRKRRNAYDALWNIHSVTF